MNVISSLPKWAQAPARSFQDSRAIEGTSPEAATPDEADSVATTVALMTLPTALDEVEGMDQAMGEPGKVDTGDTVIYFEATDSEMSLAYTSREAPDEIVFAHLTATDTKTTADLLGLVKNQGGLAVEGYLVDASEEAASSGFKFAGNIANKR